jgi:hypothetical protein
MMAVAGMPQLMHAASDWLATCHRAASWLHKAVAATY